MLKKFLSLSLIILHFATFGPIREAMAFYGESTSFKLSSTLSQGGSSGRGALVVNLKQASFGEPCALKGESTSYILRSGYISTIQPRPPELKQKIPCQYWNKNAAKPDAFDLDDYFQSIDNYTLTYSVDYLTISHKINASIDPITHVVSFSQPADFSGTEEVQFTATDSQRNSTSSNIVSLQVIGENNQPVIEDVTISPALAAEGQTVTLIVKARDVDEDEIHFSFDQFFVQKRVWQDPLDPQVRYAEATWVPSAAHRGYYSITVTATDSTVESGALFDTYNADIFVKGENHAPVIKKINGVDVIPGIPVALSANEGQLFVFSVDTYDQDNNTINVSFHWPFENVLGNEGKWDIPYTVANSANPAVSKTIVVAASDRLDTVSATVLLTVHNINKAPVIDSFLVTRATLLKNETTTITLRASDFDNDTLTATIRDASTVIASGPLVDGALTSTRFWPEEGYHTLTAQVTDPSGLTSSVATQNIHVTDYADVNPLMGDFNGDALTDLGVQDYNTGAWEVCLSNRGVFTAAQSWLTGFGDSRDWIPVGGDFNGDAKSDIGIYNWRSGELKIGLSDGTGFTPAGIWLTVPGASYNRRYCETRQVCSGGIFGGCEDVEVCTEYPYSSWQPFSGNFNADRFTDFAIYNKDTGEVKIALGTGASFGALQAWSTGLGTEYSAMAGDFNGDSLTDLLLFKKSSGEFKVAFSNSRAFVVDSAWTPFSGFAVDKDATLSDFNNDGLTDVGYFDKDTGRWAYAISTGSRFRDMGLWLEGFGSSSCESGSTGDFDGNGITDVASFDKDLLGINRWRVQLLTDKPADLLTEIDNNTGGKTNVTYTYASGMDNPDLPFPVYVASVVTLSDNLPAGKAPEDYTQNFTYKGGYFDSTEREFRGFAQVKVTDPITNNYSNTFFHQGKQGEEGALKGQIEKIESYDGNGRLISRAVNIYRVIKGGPGSGDKFLGFPSLETATTTVNEENDQSLTTEDKFIYDGVGNVVEQKNEGEVSKTGDERTAVTNYAPAYLTGFNRPLDAYFKDQGLNVVTEKHFTYDTRGNLVTDRIVIINPIAQTRNNSTTQYSYDSFGNLTTTTNALGRAVTTEYETDLYTYPERITNALGHSISYTYDYKLGLLLSVTDANQKTTTTHYDSLGRVEYTQDALGQIPTRYSYPDFNTKVTTQGALVKREYADGIGRKYKTISSGEDGNVGRNVISETFYNNRGAVDYESLPHYVGESEGNISYVRYTYDIRGRIKETLSDFLGELKDARAKIFYGPNNTSSLYTETEDPQGHRKGTLKDIFGNIIEVKEFVSSEPEAKPDGAFHTTYEYDIQGNLIKTTDNKGNIIRIFYDSIGRKIKMIDPDMGEWSYEYDILGNLIKQTDAKGQILEFQYDALNRLTQKQSRIGAAYAGLDTLVTYLYDDPAKPNCIGRLSKVIDQSGSTEFFYDDLGREIKSVKGLSPQGTVPEQQYTVQREYDQYSRLTRLTYPDNFVVQYDYDTNSGLLQSVVSLRGAAGDEAISYVKDISYNAKGQIKDIAYGNSTSTHYTYGSDLRLQRILTQNTSGVSIQDLTYDFNANGNLATLTDNLHSNTRTYRYDDLDRLTEARNSPSLGGGYTNFLYAYDSIGNMLEKREAGAATYMTYGEGLSPQGTVPKPHAVTSVAGSPRCYDANGNMLNAPYKAYFYDIENRLTQVSEGATINTFTYDGDGGLVRATKGLSPQGTVLEESTTYIGSLFEVDSDGKTTKHIFAGANKVCSVTKGLSPQGTVPEVSYFHTDHLGSSNVITDKNGNQVSYYEYTPYGSLARGLSPQGTVPEDAPTHYLFTGKQLFDTIGLYHYGARFYDPEIGRFITPDTIVQAPYDSQSLNRYSYCRNNPINYIDPSGHVFVLDDLIAAVIIGALIGGAIGGIGAAISGGNIGMGILMGAVGGALTGGGASAAYGIWGAAWAWAGAAAGGAVSGAANAAVSGGNIWAGALVGGIGAGVGCGVGYAVGLSTESAFWGVLAGSTSGTLASTGADVALNGSDFGSNIGMNLALSTAGALAGYGISKASSSSNKTQKATQQLETDQKPIISPNDGEGPYIGEEIFRVFDGIKSKWDGKSWTPVNPNSVPNYRAQAGLPDNNSGRFVAQARITNTDNIVVRKAIVIYGNGDVKMVREYLFKNPPKGQIKLERVSGANPEF